MGKKSRGGGESSVRATCNARYGTKTSAYRSMCFAKERKKRGISKKSKKGADLKRWKREKWVNIATGRKCGNKKDKFEKCRPSKKVSSKTPKIPRSKKEKERLIRQKRKVGMGHKTKSYSKK